jgi:nucleoid DNA-binding protein
MSFKRSDSDYGKLVALVEAKGFSLRKSARAVQAVFDCMRRAVARGEIVEIPGGKLQAVTAPKPERKWRRMTTPKKKVFFRTVTRFKNPRRVRFRPDPHF